MRYIINYTKKNNFIKDAVLTSKAEGNELGGQMKYTRPNVPKTVRNYVPHIDYRKNAFIIDATQKELDEIVAEIGFYDKNGNVITNAPLKNPNAPFWKHADLFIRLESSGTSLDDDDPLQKFWIKCFKADSRFRFAGDKIAPSLASRVQYTVSKITEDMSEKSQELDETYVAMKLLTSNEDNLEKLTSVLRAMGWLIKNPEPKIVRSSLMALITDKKHMYPKGSSENNIETFIRLMEAKTATLNLKGLIAEALSKNIINKDGSGQYFYGELKLGSNKNAIEEFLTKSDNSDIYGEIITKVKG